jgi:hypothetical protein
MEVGRWRLEDGRWRLEVGGWKMEDGRWVIETNVLLKEFFFSIGFSEGRGGKTIKPFGITYPMKKSSSVSRRAFKLKSRLITIF